MKSTEPSAENRKDDQVSKGRGAFSVQDYLDRSGAGESSLRTYRKLFARCEEILGRPLIEASAHALADLKTELRKMRSGANYVRRLKSFYKVAGRPDLAELCVLKQRIHRLDANDILTLPEVNELLAAALSLRDRALIATLWATAQRVGAVCALRLDDLRDVPSDNGGGAIRVSFRKVKVTGEEHASYILDRDGGDHLRAWLKAYPYPRTGDAPVFPSYRFAPESEPTPLTESGALKIVQSTARRAVPGKRVYCHLFRHSRATHWLRIGMSPVDVKNLGGWSPGSPVMERTYAHLVDHDAYIALLRANGLPTPEIVDVGKLAAAEGQLKPVVPIRAPPGTGATDIEPSPALTSSEMDRLLKDPNVLRVLQLLQEARAKGRGA